MLNTNVCHNLQKDIIMDKIVKWIKLQIRFWKILSEWIVLNNKKAIAPPAPMFLSATLCQHDKLWLGSVIQQSLKPVYLAVSCAQLEKISVVYKTCLCWTSQERMLTLWRLWCSESWEMQVSGGRRRRKCWIRKRKSEPWKRGRSETEDGGRKEKRKRAQHWISIGKKKVIKNQGIREERNIRTVFVCNINCLCLT